MPRKHEPPPGDEELMTRAEVAQLFRTTPKTVSARVKREELPQPVAGSRHPIMFVRAKVMEYLHGVPPPPPRRGRKKK